MAEQAKAQGARTWLGVRLGVVLRALGTTVAFLGVLWAIQAINSVTGYALTHHLGLQARDPGSLPMIFTVELVHVGWGHIEANSIWLAILVFLIALRGPGRFLGVTLFILAVGGGLYWLFGPGHVACVGASGLAFGYLGYAILCGLVERDVLMVTISVVTGALFALLYSGDLGVIFEYLVPSRDVVAAHISWQGHLCGLVAGIFATGLYIDPDTGTVRKKAVAKGVGAGSPAPTGASGGITDEELDRLLKDL